MMKMTVYVTDWCPFCFRLLTGLNREGLEYDVVDIEVDANAARIVEEINAGNRTVPTVVFADGTTMTNPPLAQVQGKLARLSVS